MKIINRSIKKYGSLKVFLVLISILMFINIIILTSFDTNQKTFRIDGLSFKYAGLDNTVWLFKDKDYNLLKAYTLEGTKRLDYLSRMLIVEYKGQTIRYEKNLISLETKIFVDDLLIHTDSMIKISGDYTLSISDGTVQNPSEINEPFESKLMNEIINTSSYVLDVGLINLLIFSTLFTLLGTTHLIFPKAYWHLRHFLSVSGGEPTDFFIAATQISGLLLIIFGLFFPLVIPFI